MTLFAALVISSLLACAQTNFTSLKEIAREAYIYAYPMMEQVRTVNGMRTFMGVEFNHVAMNPRLPWDNVGQPIVAPNLTSMTGGIAISLSEGPITLEIPEVKDRYIVYQCIDVFTHNFFYMGSRANQGEGGRFVFHTRDQKVTESDVTAVEVEGDHVIIVVRIDIANAGEIDRVREIQKSIRLVDAPEPSFNYTAYDEEKARSLRFVE